MYIGLLHVHNATRWLVLIAAVVAIAVAVRGLVRNDAWGRGARLSGLAFVILMDVQLLVGLLLYFVSPTVRAGLGDVSLAMADARLRFFLVEHALLMVGAVVLVHLGYAQAKRASTPRPAYVRSTVFYLLGLLAVLAGIPWWRPLLPGI
jgi:hypothetical protein